jgi:hypothetical protein
VYSSPSIVMIIIPRTIWSCNTYEKKKFIKYIGKESSCKRATIKTGLREVRCDFPHRLPGFSPMSVHVGFVVDKLRLGAGFLRVLQFPLLIIISSNAPFLSSIIWHTDPAWNLGTKGHSLTSCYK